MDRNSRNSLLIRNLIGRQVGEYVVRWVEQIHAGAPDSFETESKSFFSCARSASQLPDVSVWVVRVLPDNAAQWMHALMAKYREVKYSNPIFVHQMLVTLLQTTAALESVPTSSSEQGKEYEQGICEWFSELLVDGKTVVLIPEFDKTISMALKTSFKHHLTAYRMRDTGAAFIAADDKYLWKKRSLTEFVVRESAALLVRTNYTPDQILSALAKYQGG